MFKLSTAGPGHPILLLCLWANGIVRWKVILLGFYAISLQHQLPTAGPSSCKKCVQIIPSWFCSTFLIHWNKLDLCYQSFWVTQWTLDNWSGESELILNHLSILCLQVMDNKVIGDLYCKGFLGYVAQYLDHNSQCTQPMYISKGCRSSDK